MRRIHRAFALAFTFSVGAACANEDPPTDCGDSTMSIVTFRGKTDDKKDEIRTCIDIHAASRLDAASTARGVDDSYATSRPNALPWTNLTFHEAVEACSRAGKFLCTSDELRAIGSATEQFGRATFDDTSIDALSPTSAITEVPHQFVPLNRYDVFTTKDRIAYPESSGSVAFWTASPKADDKSVDPTVPRILGRISGEFVVGGDLTTTPVLDPEYKHPLLGFRCCINAKMRDAFVPLPRDPNKVRAHEDEEVPLAPLP